MLILMVNCAYIAEFKFKKIALKTPPHPRELDPACVQVHSPNGVSRTRTSSLESNQHAAPQQRQQQSQTGLPHTKGTGSAGHHMIGEYHFYIFVVTTTATVDDAWNPLATAPGWLTSNLESPLLATLTQLAETARGNGGGGAKRGIINTVRKSTSPVCRRIAYKSGGQAKYGGSSDGTYRKRAPEKISPGRYARKLPRRVWTRLCQMQNRTSTGPLAAAALLM